jgi:hypothetical protein
MTFRSSVLVPLAVVMMLAGSPGASHARPVLPPAEAGVIQPSVASCLGRTEVLLCLLQIPSMRGYSRVPADGWFTPAG